MLLQNRNEPDPSRNSGTGATRDEMVERHLDLAETIARRYIGRGIDADDLTQVAMLALVEAVDRFDPDRGAPFWAYASATIRGALKRQFRDQGWAVRPPRSVQEAHLAVRSAVDRLNQQLGRSPEPAEIADRTGLDEHAVRTGLAAADRYRAESLQAPGRPEGLAMVKALAVSEPGFGQAAARFDAERLLRRLGARDARMLELRFWEDRTQAEIAVELGISQMHVSRLLRKVITLLRARGEEPSSPHRDDARGVA